MAVETVTVRRPARILGGPKMSPPSWRSTRVRADGDKAVTGVEVVAAQRGEFAVAQTGEGCQQDQHAGSGRGPGRWGCPTEAG